jgi:hypothetical protein
MLVGVFSLSFWWLHREDSDHNPSRGRDFGPGQGQRTSSMVIPS